MDYTPGLPNNGHNGPVMQNSILVFGKVSTLPELHHELMDEQFFQFFLDVPRLSSSMDRLPVTVSQRLLDLKHLEIGQTVGISGQIRAYKRITDGVGHLLLTIFGRQWTEGMENPGQNQVSLTGRLARPASYRVTPFGREITDMLVEVPRSYNKSDIVPCIAWGRFARSCGNYPAGARVALTGRLQSRIYQKKLPDETVVDKTAYEVSVHTIHQVLD